MSRGHSKVTRDAGKLEILSTWSSNVHKYKNNVRFRSCLFVTFIFFKNIAILSKMYQKSMKKNPAIKISINNIII